MFSTRTLAAAVACAASVTTLTAGPQNQRTFDNETPDVPPTGFTFAAMRQEAHGAWLVRREGTNGFLSHPAVAGSRGFSMAIADSEPLGDVAVSVKIRLSSGNRLAGIISRYQNPQNYYMTVLDLEDGELRMFRVFEGNRNQIEHREDLELNPDIWHVLKVVHYERSVTALLNGVPVFEDGNRVNRAFPPGRCGVITSGDTDASFDDFRVEPAQRILNRQ